MVSPSTKTIALVKSPDDQYNAKYTIDYSINNEYPSMLGSVTASTSDMSYTIFPQSAVESTEWYFTITYESVYISISYNLNGGTRVGGNDARTYGSYDILSVDYKILLKFPISVCALEWKLLVIFVDDIFYNRKYNN